MKKFLQLSKISCLALLCISFSQSAKAQKDVTPPVIEYKGDSSCIQIGSVWLNKLEVTDNQSDKFSIAVKQSWQKTGPLNSLVRGIYILEVEAVDSNGNKSKRVISLKVDDCIPPVIDLNTKDTVCVKYRTPYNSISPKATDNYYSSSQVSLVKKSGNVNTNILGTYTEVFEAVDGSGNITTKTRVVLVTEDCASTASLNQLDFMQLNIHPNPAQNFIAVELTNLYTAEPLVITVVSMDGKQVFESTIDKSLKIDVSGFSNGVYSVGIKGGSKVINKVFVIQH